MRVLLKCTFPVGPGNKGIRDGSLAKAFRRMAEELKPEATYFLSEHGERTAYFFFDLSSPSQIPSVAEPLFMDFDAKVEFIPVMNATDLREGLEKATSRL